MNKEKEAEVIPLGTTIIFQFCCSRCGLPGSAIGYKHYVKWLSQIGIFCEDCRHHNMNSINVDLTHCQELVGRPIFPQGIAWATRKMQA